MKINKKKYVKARSIEEYFALPKNQRQKWGFWYLKPLALPWDGLHDNESKNGWSEFSRQIRKQYPIQGFFREWFFDYDNPVYSFIMVKKMQLNDFWYGVKCFFKPSHPIIRKALPKKWCDITSLLIDVNLAMIEQFYIEASESFIDWESDDKHINFYSELKKANKYIKETRPKLLKRIDRGYEFAQNNKDLDYNAKYSTVNYTEKFIDSFDKKYIKWAIDNKDFFWT
jgi:hypothetical protein